MLTSVALLVSQVSVVDWPLSIVLGLAVSDAVGAGGGGGGGGGGGATFFLQAPSIRMAPSANTSVIHFIFGCFTFSSVPNRVPVACGAQLTSIAARVNFSVTAGFESELMLESTIFDSANYFQLQLGCVLLPVKVNCWTLVPSASMVQICSLPERLDWNTMCLPSGDHDGKSLRPPSWLNCTHWLLAMSIR